MITPAEISDKMKDNAMTKHARDFESVMQQIRDNFYDLPAPESEYLTWDHVANAKHVVTELHDVANFLKITQ